jgi:P27 family predicted phage terminase small subunit
MKGAKPAKIAKAQKPFKLGKAPAWFPPDAATEWKRCAPVLNERKILSKGDLASFENYCLCVGQIRDLDRTLQAEGLIIDTPRGKRAHPAFRLVAVAMAASRLLAVELGLTPVSRSRPSIRSSDDEEENDQAYLD